MELGGDGVFVSRASKKVGLCLAGLICQKSNREPKLGRLLKVIVSPSDITFTERGRHGHLQQWGDMVCFRF